MISHGLVLDELPSHTEALTHAETPSAVQQILVDQVQKLATQRKRQSTSSAEVKSIKEIKARLAGEEPPAEDADEEMQMTEVSLVVAVVREGGQMGAGFKWGRASNGGGLQMRPRSREVFSFRRDSFALLLSLAHHTLISLSLPPLPPPLVGTDHKLQVSHLVGANGGGGSQSTDDGAGPRTSLRLCA